MIEPIRLCDASSSRMTWQNMSSPSSIRRIWLNDDDLYLSVSSKLLIEDQLSIQRPCPILSIYMLLWWCKPFLGVSINRYVWTSQSLNLLFSSSFRLIYASDECLKSRFRWENRKNLSLELWIFFFQNKKPWYDYELDHLEHDFGLIYMFSSYIFSCSIIFQFWIIF